MNAKVIIKACLKSAITADTERLDARDRHNLDIALKMSNISHSVPLHEALSTLNEKDKETAISFMTLNIYRQLEKTPEPLKADLTSLINDQIEKFNTDPNFKAICCASNIAKLDGSEGHIALQRKMLKLLKTISPLKLVMANLYLLLTI